MKTIHLIAGKRQTGKTNRACEIAAGYMKETGYPPVSAPRTHSMGKNVDQVFASVVGEASFRLERVGSGIYSHTLAKVRGAVIVLDDNVRGNLSIENKRVVLSRYMQEADILIFTCDSSEPAAHLLRYFCAVNGVNLVEESTGDVLRRYAGGLTHFFGNPPVCERIDQ